MVTPYRARGSANRVDKYIYSFAGYREEFDPEDIVHLIPAVDPRNTARGLSKLKGALREIVTDNEASVFSASMLGNRGFTGAIVRPKEGSGKPMSPQKIRELKDQYNAEFVGEGAGGVLVLSGAFEVDRPPGYTPAELTLDVVRKMPEARVAGLMGVPAVVAGLTIGLETSTAKASHKDSRAQAYESCIIPTKGLMAEQLSNQLLVEWLPGDEIARFDALERIRVGWDYTQVAALQEAQTDKVRRSVIGYKGGVFDRAEARDIAGVPVRPEDNDVWFPGTDPASNDQLTSGGGGDVNNPNPTAPNPDSTPGSDGDPVQGKGVWYERKVWVETAPGTFEEQWMTVLDESALPQNGHAALAEEFLPL
jgi:hypothetical protein